VEGVARKSVALFATRRIGVRCLEELLRLQAEGQVSVAAVRTLPPGARGWWSRPGEPEVDDVARAAGVRVLEADQDLLDLQVDLAFSVFHPFILKPPVISHPGQGFVNLHGAPLPRYRGCNVVTHGLINGEQRWGPTLHFIDSGIDTGPIIRVGWFDVPVGMTGRELAEATDEVGFRVFCEELPGLLAGTTQGTPQDEIIRAEGVRPLYHRRTSIQGLKELDPAWPLEQIDRYVRAFDFPPFEPAWFRLPDGRKLYLTAEKGRQP
jgi:methionyl-tRNA formyltransferase